MTHFNRPAGPSLPAFIQYSPQAQVTHDGQASSLSAHTSPRHLNPLFGAWLMGWPSTWVIAEPHASSALETELFHCRLQWRLSCLLAEQVFLNFEMDNSMNNTQAEHMEYLIAVGKGGEHGVMPLLKTPEDHAMWEANMRWFAAALLEAKKG
jgi:hypothetical protein